MWHQVHVSRRVRRASLLYQLPMRLRAAASALPERPHLMKC